MKSKIYKTLSVLGLLFVGYHVYGYLDSCSMLTPFPRYCNYEVSWR
jgi:hypothetical protein